MSVSFRACRALRPALLIACMLSAAACSSFDWDRDYFDWYNGRCGPNQTTNRVLAIDDEALDLVGLTEGELPTDRLVSLRAEFPEAPHLNLEGRLESTGPVWQMRAYRGGYTVSCPFDDVALAYNVDATPVEMRMQGGFPTPDVGVLMAATDATWQGDPIGNVQLRWRPERAPEGVIDAVIEDPDDWSRYDWVYLDLYLQPSGDVQEAYWGVMGIASKELMYGVGSSWIPGTLHDVVWSPER